jgi:predicted component of type VI protein secretion system
MYKTLKLAGMMTLAGLAILTGCQKNEQSGPQKIAVVISTLNNPDHQTMPRAVFVLLATG